MTRKLSQFEKACRKKCRMIGKSMTVLDIKIEIDVRDLIRHLIESIVMIVKQTIQYNIKKPANGKITVTVHKNM